MKEFVTLIRSLREISLYMQSENYVNFDPRIPKQEPKLSRLIIFLIVLIYVIEIFFNALHSEKAIILLGAKWNEGITNGQYYRFITPVFLHGNLIHLLLNVFAIKIFAQELESVYGSYRFLITFLLTSWGATLASYAFSKGLAIGASGFLFGVIGSLLVFFFRQREKLSGATMRFKTMYTLILINLALGFIIPRIDNSAHIGGLLSGIACGWFISPEYKIEKDEPLERLYVMKKPDLSRVLSGLVLVITILFWLTKLAIQKHLNLG